MVLGIKVSHVRKAENHCPRRGTGLRLCEILKECLYIPAYPVCSNMTCDSVTLIFAHIDAPEFWGRAREFLQNIRASVLELG